MAPPDPSTPSGSGGRPGWRSPEKTRGQAGKPAAGGWAQKPDQALERAALRYRSKVIFWSLSFVALMALFIWWLLPSPKRTPFLVASVTAYDYPLAPNAWALEDAKRLENLDQEEKIVSYIPVAFDEKETGLQQLCQQLQAVEPSGPGKNVLVIYLSMHGMLNAAGEPCLLLPGDSRTESAKWLRVADLLDRLFPSNLPALRSEAVKKLLIFDASRMDLNWNAGLLYNGFADRLAKVLETKNIPGLVVLSSAGPGQRAWAAPELQGSVFGYFLGQGLQGAANTEQSGNRDDKVSLRELYAYLKAHVFQWVLENRADRQVPLLWPQDAADFPLTYARPHKETQDLPTKMSRDPRWERLYALWKTHTALQKEQPWRLHPLAWEEFQQRLLRLEQLIQAGKAYDEQFNAEIMKTESLIQPLKREEAGAKLAAYSLPLARCFGKGVPEKEWQKLPLPGKASPAPPKAAGEQKTPAEGEKAAANKQKIPAEGEKAAPASEKKPPPESKKSSEKAAGEKPAEKAEKPTELHYGYPAAATAVWNEVLKHHPLNQEALSKLLQFVDRSQGRLPGEPDVVEVHFLRMINRFLDSSVWQTAANQVEGAILARDWAERAAAPADERVFYWIHPLVDQGDKLRRQAEDRLFLGSDKALTETPALWAQAIGEQGQEGGKYEQAVERAEELAAAYALRDRAYGEIPYLTQWSLSRTSPAAEPDALLRSTIEMNQQLADRLNAEAQNDQIFEEVRIPADRLRKSLDRLKLAYSGECSRLLTAGEDKQTLADIINVLAVPLVTEERRDLWEKYFEIIRKFRTLQVGDQVPLTTQPTGTSAEKETESVASRKLQRLSAWKEHPVLTILKAARRSAGREDTGELSASVASSPPSSGPSEAISIKRQLDVLAQEGEQVRRLLRQTHSDAEQGLEESVRLSKSLEPTPLAIRQPLGRADNLVRAAAPFLFGRRLWSEPTETPAYRLRMLDWHQLLMWHARRILDDFWGPRDHPFFESVAKAYLQTAGWLWKEDVSLREGSVPQLLEARKQAAEKGIRVEKPPVLFVDDHAVAAKLALILVAPKDVPQGEGAVYLQDPNGKLLPLLSEEYLPKPDLRRLEGALTGKAEQIPLEDCWIPNNDRLRDTRLLQAVAYYRGHEQMCEFYVETATGLDITYQRPNYPTPIVTVCGKSHQSVNLMFILDCSGSMESQSGETTRLAAAKAGLEAILQHLLIPQNPYHVGLRIYGHRVGWNPNNTDQILYRNPHPPPETLDKPPPKLVGIVPSTDVERVLDLGPFTEKQSRKVHEILATLRPMGETPLYLAIIESIGDLNAVEPGTPRHIIAITDGLNNQSEGGALKKSLEDVQRELDKNPDIRLDIVGFALSREKSSELVDLAKRTGGDFYPVTNPEGLSNAVEKSLGLIQYEVFRGREKITSEPLDLNTPCKLRVGDRPVEYRVELVDRERPASAEVTVEGGEDLKLFVEENPRRLVYHRYDENLRASCTVNTQDGSQKRSFFLGAHIPKWVGKGVKFFVSIQNGHPEQFSPRPAEIWAEITPKMPDAGAESPVTYFFYDPLYVSASVPLLEFVAPKWPPEAGKAEISLWCKMEQTPPVESTVAEALGRRLHLDTVPEVNLEVSTQRGERAGDLHQVIVVESHPPGSSLGTLKVAISPPPNSPPPEKIIHRYNPKMGTVTHTFYFDETVSAAAMGQYRLQFTAKSELVEGAIATPRPLEVTVPPE